MALIVPMLKGKQPSSIGGGGALVSNPNLLLSLTRDIHPLWNSRIPISGVCLLGPTFIAAYYLYHISAFYQLAAAGGGLIGDLSIGTRGEDHRVVRMAMVIGFPI